MARSTIKSGEITKIGRGFLDPTEPTRLSEAGKEQAFGEIDKAFTEGAREKSAVAGASGFSGAGGRTQDLLGEMAVGTAEAKGKTGLAYDQALSDLLFQREQAGANILAQEKQSQQQQPQWYDYLLGGLGAAGDIVGSLGSAGLLQKRPKAPTPV